MQRGAYGAYPLIPAQAGIQGQNTRPGMVLWVPAFRLRAPRFGGLEPAEARAASEDWVSRGRVDEIQELFQGLMLRTCQAPLSGLQASPLSQDCALPRT
jgi:hypothetical protein